MKGEREKEKGKVSFYVLKKTIQIKKRFSYIGKKVSNQKRAIQKHKK